MRWSVPPMWAGETVAVLASGPSMSQAVADKVREAGVRVIAINTTVQLAPWADMLYAADREWWTRYWGDTESFKGLKVTCDPNNDERLLVLRNSGKAGFETDPSCIRTGGNSGYQAIHVAAHAGASRILLCGFDMRGEGHWHGKHPGTLRNAGPGIFNEWLPHFHAMEREMRTKCKPIEIINCTPNSALTVWPRMPLDVALTEVTA